MIIRTVLAVAIIAVGITAVVADIISDRKDLMKRSGAQAKAGAALVAGREPFDLAKAKGVFELYIDKANKLPSAVRGRPKAGEETDAAPAIWDKAAEFKAQGEKFGASRRPRSTRPRTWRASRPSLPSCSGIAPAATRRSASRAERITLIVQRRAAVRTGRPSAFRGPRQRLRSPLDHVRAGGELMLRRLINWVRTPPMWRNLLILAVIARRLRPRRVLAGDDSRHRAGERARRPTRPTSPTAKSCFCRRLRLLPRHPGPGGQDPARRRARAEIAVRDFLRARIFRPIRRTASAPGPSSSSSPP